MGSAQSARRIQPGGARPAVPRRADLSRSPFLPTPPPARPFPSSPRGGWGRRAGGAGGGVGGGPPRGRLPAAAGRTSTVGGAPRPAPGRLGRPGGEGGSGGAAPPVGAEPPRPECYSPPAAALAESRGRGNRIPVAALSSPPPLPSWWWWGAEAGPPLPRRDRSPTSPPPRGSRGRGGLSSVRPGRRRAVGPGGFRRSRRSGSPSGAEPSARGRRRCRLPTRPVLKHGPRSLTRARVRGSSESRRGAMKVKGPPFAGARGGIPRPLPVRRGRTTGPSRPPRRGGGARAHALGPERW